MKIPVLTAMLLLIIAVFETTAFAASYTDDMNGATSDSVKRYSGFAAYTFGGSVPDRTALTFSSMLGPSLSAHADYRAEGAETVLVSIYSPCGTFASQNGSDVYLGVYSNMPYIQGQNLRQALLFPATAEVYTDVGGPGKLYCDDALLNILKFRQVDKLPGGLVGYGVNVGYSSNGQSFSAANLRYVNLQNINDSLCYEQYIASIPSGAKYIRVEINDVVTVEGLGSKGGSATRYTALASVSITGDSLTMGEPEAIVELPQGEYYIGEGVSSDGGESRDAASAATGESGDSRGQSSSTSKFEGSITSSSKSAREREGAKSSAAKSEEKSSKSSSGSTSSEESREETTVYQIRRDEGGGFLDGAIIAYIVAISGALALLVILKKR